MPDVPTFAEAGFPKANLMSVFGIFAPAGIPQAVLTRLNTEINSVLALPDMKARLVESDNVPTGGTSAEFDRLIRAESDSNRDIIRQAGIRLD
jgi:tripartite-type tricarboxylate transporter receptor subunit TctC